MAQLRVDNLPLALRPLVWLYGWSLCLVYYLFAALMRLTVRYRLHGAPPAGAYIECIWHENLTLYMAQHLRYRRPYVWMNHPIWYMKPIHVLLGLMGVRQLCLGSSGHGGRRALDALARYVRQGHSTLLAVDGPAGPVRVLKPGAPDLALQTGVPLLALRYVVGAQWRLPSWDGKRIPRPFTRIDVYYTVVPLTDADQYHNACQALTQAMG